MSTTTRSQNAGEKWTQLAEDELKKLADMKTERDNLMTQRDHEIVGTDGKLTYTYDVAKVYELNKKITDEELRIARDAQIKTLEDRKKFIEQEVEAEPEKTDKISEPYEADKKGIDDYWTNSDGIFRLHTKVEILDANYAVVAEGSVTAAINRRSARDVNLTISNASGRLHTQENPGNGRRWSNYALPKQYEVVATCAAPTKGIVATGNDITLMS